MIDPEVGMNIVDLGLVYGLDLEGHDLTVRLTMTTPACPLSEYLGDLATRAIRAAHPDLTSVSIAWVWDPPWTPARMSADARRELGWGD